MQALHQFKINAASRSSARMLPSSSITLCSRTIFTAHDFVHMRLQRRDFAGDFLDAVKWPSRTLRRSLVQYASQVW